MPSVEIERKVILTRKSVKTEHWQANEKGRLDLILSNIPVGLPFIKAVDRTFGCQINSH